MMSMEYSAIDMATLAFLASLCKDVAAAIGWHGAMMWAEVVGYGLLMGVTVLKALGTG